MKIKEPIKKLLGKRLTGAVYKIKRRVTNPRYYYYLRRRWLNPKALSSGNAPNVISMFNFSRPIIAWFEDGGQRLLVEHSLHPDSVVMDVGGYTGYWTDKLFQKHNCDILVYEPVAEYYAILKQKFGGNPKISAMDYGLGGCTRTCRISVAGVQSSTLESDRGQSEEVRIVDIGEEMKSRDRVDLISINIEGGEYELLQRMIELDITHAFRNIQVQFHEWFPSFEASAKLRASIHEALARTHTLTYNYPFVWENWKLRAQLGA